MSTIQHSLAGWLPKRAFGQLSQALPNSMLTSNSNPNSKTFILQCLDMGVLGVKTSPLHPSQAILSTQPIYMNLAPTAYNHTTIMFTELTTAAMAYNHTTIMFTELMTAPMAYNHTTIMFTKLMIAFVYTNLCQLSLPSSMYFCHCLC